MIFHDWVETEIISGLTPMAWYQYQYGGSANHIIYDSIGDKHLIGDASNAPVLTENVIGGQPGWYFDGTKDPLVYSGDVEVKHVFILASNADATFDDFQGLLTGETVGDVLVGSNGTTKFFDLGIGNLYTKEGTAFDESNQQAPMSGTFRLLEVKTTTGIILDGIQVGQQRGLTARRWKGHFVEMICFSRVLTAAEIRRVRLYFNIKFGEWQRGLPFQFPSADMVPTIGPSRFYDAPKDYDKITDSWEYEDGTKDFNEIADDAPMRWEYAYPAVPKSQLPIFNEFWNQARLVNSFLFRDPDAVTWTNVRIEDYNRNHQAHMRWRHDVAFRLVGFNSVPSTDPAPEAPPTGLTATAMSGSSILLEWDTPEALPDTEAPTAPVLSSATADSDTEVTMIWAASSDDTAVTGYETRIDGGAWTDRGLVLTYQYTGLTASTSYDFEVRAYDAAGNFSDPSNLISETTDAPGATPIALVDSVDEGSTDSNGFTTSAINSTGATLLVVAVSYYASGGAGTLTDSKGNTYTALTAQSSGGPISRLYYCQSPVVGSGHTFSYSGTANFPSVVAMAFENAGIYDSQESGAHNAGATDQTMQPGSITPSQNDCLVVASLGSQTSGGDSCDSGFTTAGVVANSGGAHVSVSAFYKVQTTAAAVNPTLATNLGFNQSMGVTMAVFRHA